MLECVLRTSIFVLGEQIQQERSDPTMLEHLGHSTVARAASA
jgi:hypothetical protein